MNKQKVRPSTTSSVFDTVRKHKILTTVVILILMIGIAIVAYVSVQNSHKFSRVDFDNLTSKAEMVLKNSGGKDVEMSRTCSYERPREFSGLHLYCRVAMAAYLPYENDEQAVGVAKNLEREGVSMGSINSIGTTDRFYVSPSNNSLTIFVNLASPYPKSQCRFEVATNKYAKVLGDGLPDRNENNLIALSFYCAAESKGEYFPVTYRQG